MADKLYTRRNSDIYCGADRIASMDVFGIEVDELLAAANERTDLSNKISRAELDEMRELLTRTKQA